MRNYCDHHSRPTFACRDCWSILHSNLDHYFCEAERAEKQARESKAKDRTGAAFSVLHEAFAVLYEAVLTEAAYIVCDRCADGEERAENGRHPFECRGDTCYTVCPAAKIWDAIETEKARKEK